MKSRNLCLFAALAAVLCCVGVTSADVLDVVPERSLVAVVTRDADGFQNNLQRLVAEVAGHQRFGGGHLKDATIW